MLNFCILIKIPCPDLAITCSNAPFSVLALGGPEGMWARGGPKSRRWRGTRCGHLSVLAPHWWLESGEGGDCKDRPRSNSVPKRNKWWKTSKWKMPNRKRKEENRAPCRTEKNHGVWEGVKARTLEEMSSWSEWDDLSLSFDGPYLTGILITMKWEMLWKSS